MKDFTFELLARATDAASAVAARPGAMFLAGGTTVVDLMKVDVLTPDTLVDVRRLELSLVANLYREGARTRARRQMIKQTKGDHHGHHTDA